MKDGTIAFTDNINTIAGGRILQTIDFAAKSFGRTIELPDVGWQTYPASGGDYDLLSGDGSVIYGVTVGQEPVKILDFLESDIIANDVQSLVMISEEQFIYTNRTWDNAQQRTQYEIVMLTKTPYDELPEKTVIMLATLYLRGVRDAVVKFNRESMDYRIQVIDYSEFNTEDDFNAGLMRLSNEIASGKIPDIINVEGLPYREYVEKGVLTDLYPFIDADPELSRDDFLQSPLKAAEIDGKLYQAFSTFSVETIIGHPSVVGEAPGWTLDEFKAVLDAHPEADLPLGIYTDRLNFLQSVLSLGMDRFISRETGEVSFESPDFIRLLEYTSILPDEAYLSANVDVDINSYENHDTITGGRQIMMTTRVSQIMYYMYEKTVFGGDIVFKGYPSDDRNGNAFSMSNGLAIAESSESKEGAWSFVRSILAEGAHSHDYWGLPLNKKAFDASVEEAKKITQNGNTYGINGIMLDAPTQEEIDKIIALISSTNRMIDLNSSYDTAILGIVAEGASDYFIGLTSAQEAARVIQSRVSTLIAEQS